MTQVSVLVMCHTRELAFQIAKEYERFSKYMPGIKVTASHLVVVNNGYRPVCSLVVCQSARMRRPSVKTLL